MNVALSRAKERIIIVGNKDVFAGRSHMHKLWSSLANEYQTIDLRPRKTEHCAHWLIDICPNGDMCNFIHNPTKRGSFAGKADGNDCVFWLKGAQCKQDDCRFRHDTAKEGILKLQIYPRFKDRDCIFWMQGSCNRTDCLYRHDDAKKGLFASSHAQDSLNKFYANHLVPLLKQRDDPEALHNLLKTHKLVEPHSGEWHREPVFKFKDLKSRSILQVAARLGCHQIADQLITVYRCDVNYQNEEGYTALIWAAWHAHTDTVSVLLRHGAKPELRCFVHYNDTALEAAQYAQKFWTENPDHKNLFPAEIGANMGWEKVDFRCRADYQWTPDWSKIMHMLNDPSTEQATNVQKKLFDCKNIEEMSLVVNDQLNTFDHKTLVMAWKWMLEEKNNKPVGEYVQQTLRVLEQTTLNKIRELEFKDFSRIMYQFAKHNYYSHDIPKDTLVCALEYLPNEPGRAEMVITLWAFATLNIVPSDSFFQALSKTEKLIEILNPTLMSNFLWAFATLYRMPDDGLFQKLLSKTKEMVNIFAAKQLSTMLWSFAKLRTLTRPNDWDQIKVVCEVLLSKVESRFKSSKLSLPQLEDTLWACEQLGLEPCPKLQEARRQHDRTHKFAEVSKTRVRTRFCLWLYACFCMHVSHGLHVCIILLYKMSAYPYPLCVFCVIWFHFFVDPRLTVLSRAQYDPGTYLLARMFF